MGFEIVYHYQEKKEKGYDENIKTFKKRLGDPYEDMPSEELAKSILLQLARRDIYVKDLEVYEITKKKIKYKETKNGIILKNKKYLFNEEGMQIVVEVEDIESVAQKPEEENKEIPAKQKVTQPVEQPENKFKKVLKRMIFVPEPQQQIDLLKKGIKLTIDKSYDIYQIESHPNGVNQIYTIIDDRNFTHKVSDLCFLPAPNLIGQDEEAFEEKETGNLNWSGLIRDDVPSLRRGL